MLLLHVKHEGSHFEQIATLFSKKPGRHEHIGSLWFLLDSKAQPWQDDELVQDKHFAIHWAQAEVLLS
jgi:hypothetical protein